jgi:hypothetical protein
MLIHSDVLDWAGLLPRDTNLVCLMQAIRRGHRLLVRSKGWRSISGKQSLDVVDEKHGYSAAVGGKIEPQTRRSGSAARMTN